MTSPFLPYLPVEQILSAYAKADGNEFQSGKINSPESSAALVANTFGLFLNRPNDLPPLPGLEDIDWPAHCVELEQCLRFPWTGGRHPWLDVLVETESCMIGIESKRYEPFRPRKPVDIRPIYSEHDWGAGMAAVALMRDNLINGSVNYIHFDAVQIIKHAFGIRTQARKKQKKPVLLYLYAEPVAWPNQTPIERESLSRHSMEVRSFCAAVASAEITFRACSYRELLDAMLKSSIPDVRKHAGAIDSMFPFLS